MFAIVLIVLILIAFRKQKIDPTKKGSKKELILCLSWLLCYFLLASISSASNVDIINEATNWLFLVLVPLLITAGIRKEKVMASLKEIGLKRIDTKTAVRVLLVCMVYTGVMIFIFTFGSETTNSLAGIPKMLAKFPLYFCLMLLTAAFTEEFFFRGIIQRSMEHTLNRPCIAILLTGILFGLYHFPFAFYLWDETAGNIVGSLQAVLTEQAVFGCAFGFMYDKSNKNLWSCILLHAFHNAMLMSLSVMFPGS